MIRYLLDTDTFSLWRSGSSTLAAKINIGSMDLRIAALALEIDAVVVTRNRRDYERVPGLTVEDWTTE